MSRQEALDLGRRLNQRVPFESSVRIFGTDAEGKVFTRLASTVNVSATGARVCGIHVQLRVGDVVGVQSGAEKARYAVVWVGSQGTALAGQMGLRWIEPNKWIWKIEMPEPQADAYEPPPERIDRRRSPRYACDFGVEFKTSSDAPGTYTRCTDVSLEGCYVETWSPQPVGTMLLVTATLPQGQLRGVATVRAMHPAFGMGLQFLRIENPELLEQVIQESANRGASRSLPGNMLQVVQAAASTGASPPSETISSPQFCGEALSGEPKPPARSRVLIAEDSHFLRNAYRHFLARAGFEVILAGDGEAMLQMATEQSPDVIVLDLLMPKMSGVDALKLLKDDPATSDIPVIVISALSQSNEQKLIAAGAQCYAEKTSTGPELLPEIVAKTLDVVRLRPRSGLAAKCPMFAPREAR